MSEDDFLWPPETFDAADDPALAQKLQHSMDIIFAQLRRLRDAVDGASGGTVAHEILSTTHSDTLVAVEVDGDLLRRNGGVWERLPLGLAGQALIVVGLLPTWSTDGHGLKIDASNIDQGILPDARYPHNLLSIPHSDTVAAAAQLGDVVLAQRTGTVSDSDAYWFDGQPYEDLDNSNDAAGEAYWFDGQPAVGLGSAGVTKWARKALGTSGYVLTATPTGADWQPAAGGSSLGAAVYRATDFSLADRLATAVDLSTLVFDDGGFWTIVTPSRLTIPVGGGGAYAVSALATWNTGTIASVYTHVYVNGVRRATSTGGASNAPVGYFDQASVSTVLKLNAGDYVELYVEHAASVAGTSFTVKGGTAYTFLQLGRLNSESVVATGLPSPVAGNIIQGNAGSTAYDRLAIGAVGTMLRSTGAAAAWSSDASLLTALNATQLTSGLVPNARLASVVDIAYNAGNFTSTAGTWTVDLADQITFSYVYIAANLVLVFFQFDATALTIATAQILSAALPFTPSKNCRAVMWKFDGAYGSALARVQSGTAALQFMETDATNWPLAANISITGQIAFPIS